MFPIVDFVAFCGIEELLSRKLVVAVGSYETFHGFPG